MSFFFQKSLDRVTFKKVKDVIDGPSFITDFINGVKMCLKEKTAVAGVHGRKLMQSLSKLSIKIVQPAESPYLREQGTGMSKRSLLLSP